MKSARRLKQPVRQERRRGAALVELAFALPIFLMVTFGIIEFGRAMMVGQLVTNAAREGARLGIIDGSTNAQVTTEIKNFMVQSANVSADDVTVTITITAAPGNTDPGNQLINASARDLVHIQVDVPFNKVSFIPGTYLKNKTLAGVAAMRHE